MLRTKMVHVHNAYHSHGVKENILWQQEHFVKSCCANIIIATCIIRSLVTAQTHLPENQLQSTDSEMIMSCGSVCEYEEWFSRAHCDDRGLTYVPSCTGCERATLLELQENNIQSILPERIAEYYHVRTLDISWNQISVLDPGTFFQLRDLKNIICSHNMLQTIQNGLLNGTEQHLARIYLNNNKIHTIGDKAFKNLNQLIAMYLNNNHIQSLPQNVFRDVTNIRYLILSDNDLDYVERDHFKGLTKLEYLSLDANNLKTIPKGLFTDLESLKEVLLSHNKLSAIPAPNNLGLPLNLERLDLRNNLLNLSTVIFPHLINSTWTINLNDNPIPCDCFFQSIQDALKTKPDSQTTMTCTFTNGTVNSISDYLQIICSDINKENKTDISNFTTIAPTTTPTDNSTLVTESPILQNNVGQDHGQVTTLMVCCEGITTATLIILVIFFVLWLAKSVWLRRFHIRRQKSNKSKSVPNGENKSHRAEEQNKLVQEETRIGA